MRKQKEENTIMSWNKKIQSLANKPENEGKLPSIIFPCAVVYLDNTNSEICWECANEDKEDSIWDIVGYYLFGNEEEDIAVCDNCGKSIDPALREEK